jgi:DNA-directed RNA polymerase specialized sigma24 family protein
VDLDSQDVVSQATPDELLLLDDALTALTAEEPEAGQLVKLRYFAGQSVEQAAELLGLSRTTAYEHWAYARAWLHAELYGRRERS